MTKQIQNHNITPEQESRVLHRPVISVIIPVYNVAKVLERCVDSVLTQSYHSLEVILVDDGSTDMSGKFCDVYAKRDSRIKVIHQENRGLSAARNAGLDIATGDYVTFVDSDDELEDYCLELLFDLCNNNNTMMSICGFQRRRSDADVSGSIVVPDTDSTDPSSDAESSGTNTASLVSQFEQALSATKEEPEDLIPVIAEARGIIVPTLGCIDRLLREDGFSMSAWGKLYARELFNDVRFPEGKLYEDVGTTYKLILQCPQICIAPNDTYIYYINKNSITQQNFSLRKLDLIELTDSMCDDLVAWAYEEFTDPDTRMYMECLTEKRRMHARFSILRQIVVLNKDTINAMSKNDQESLANARHAIVSYLRQNKNWVLKNPLASKRDRLAMRSLLLGLPAFRRAWLAYKSRDDADLHS